MLLYQSQDFKNDEGVAREAVLFEEFCTQEEIKLEFKQIAPKVLVHGHCHLKAFNSMDFIKTTLQMVPGLLSESLNSLTYRI
jgi:hypothetical protein